MTSRLPSGARPRRRARGLVVGVFLVGFAGIASVAWGTWADVRAEARALVDSHVSHSVSHSGWSFPARVWSAPAPLDLPAPRLVLQARARDYVEACPPGPGQVCGKTGEVVPRGGRFAEGVQPPGLDGWTRPPALEPVPVAWLVGPVGEVREHLPLADAPAHLVAALLVAEDEDFRSHGGVDVWGSGRALLANLRGQPVQGGSTLTMQLVRNLTQEKDRTVGRKLREMALAMAVDRRLGKDGVLQMYLDAPYLGQDGSAAICGFQAAAFYYWGKDARDLDLAEAATLASILPAPGRFAPDRHPEAARERRNRLLRRLGERGFDVEAALAEPIEATPHSLPVERFPAYVQAVRAELDAALTPDAVYGAGLDVWTSLDVVAQEAGDALLVERTVYLERTVGRRGFNPLRVAAAAVDPWTGALVSVHDPSMPSSTDFSRVTLAKRQPGSSFKPMVYAMAFDEHDADGAPRFTAATSMPNRWRRFGEGDDVWTPRNVGGKYTDTASLAYALSWSQNIATAGLLEEAGGPGALIAFASKLGFDTEDFPKERGIALGQAEVTPLEMARMVATFAGGGKRLAATPIERATDAAGVVRLERMPPTEQALSPEAAVLTRELMGLVISMGTGGTARGGGGFPGYDGLAVIGKTGTTDDEKDLWFVGATPVYAGALWLGYDRPTRIGAAASDLAAPLWGWWMRALHDGLDKPRDWPAGAPEVERRWICTQTGKIPVEGCKSTAAPFLPGTGPRGVCPGGHPEDEVPAGEEHLSLWKKLALEREAAAEEADVAAP